MELTKEHLQVMLDGIARIDCPSCQYVKECQSNKYTYCREIGDWIKEREENK